MHLPLPIAEAPKMLRYASSFACKKLVHTNLQLLYSCNFRCQICDFWHEDNQHKPRLSLAQVEVISRKLAQIGPQIISIGGGEPLLHPEIVPIVRALSRHHFPAMICNGWYVTPALAHALFDAGIYEVSISVDYAAPARHDALRGKPQAFERALRALSVLNASRTQRHQRVHMISVVLEDNLDQIEPLIQICRNLGITYLVTLYSHQRGTKPRKQAPADISATLLALKARYPEFVALRGYIGRFSQAAQQGGLGACQSGQSLCNVDSQGNVSLCIDRVDEPLANLLVDSPRTVEQALRHAHRTNTCADCWTSCRGSIETMQSSADRLGNLWDYVQMTRPLPLRSA